MIESDLARPGRPAWPAVAAIAIVAVALLAGAAAAERAWLAGSLTLLSRPHWIWIPVAVGLEAVSMAAFAAMFRRLLSAGRVKPRRTGMLTTVYAANALSVSVPLAGPGLATAYLFRRFTRQGAGVLLAGWTLLAGGVVTSIAWGFVLAAAGLASGRTVALAVTVPIVALAVAALIAIIAAARRPRLRATLENYLIQALRRGARLLRWPATDPKLTVRAWAERFSALRLPPSTWALATSDALVNWLTDAGVLAVSILAVGAAVPWHYLLLVYAAGIGAQSLSLTPGGLGITEGAISAALVASGLNIRQAVAAAVLYRLVSFWLKAAIGWLMLAPGTCPETPARTGSRAAWWPGMATRSAPRPGSGCS